MLNSRHVSLGPAVSQISLEDSRAPISNNICPHFSHLLWLVSRSWLVSHSAIPFCSVYIMNTQRWLAAEHSHGGICLPTTNRDSQDAPNWALPHSSHFLKVRITVHSFLRFPSSTSTYIFWKPPIHGWSRNVYIFHILKEYTLWSGIISLTNTKFQFSFNLLLGIAFYWKSIVQLCFFQGCESRLNFSQKCWEFKTTKNLFLLIVQHVRLKIGSDQQQRRNYHTAVLFNALAGLCARTAGWDITRQMLEY